MPFPADHRLVVGIRMTDSEFIGELYIPIYREYGPFLEDVYKVLNDQRFFIPVSVEFPPFLILCNKQCILWIEWEFPSFEERNTHGSWERLERTKLVLQNGTVLDGHIALIELSEGYERLQDFVNHTPFFLPLLDGEKPHLYFINRYFIVRIEHTGD